LNQLELKNVQPALDIAAESFSCGNLSGGLDVLLVPRAWWWRWRCRMPGNEPYDCPFSNEEIVIYAKQYCDLQPACLILTLHRSSTVSAVSTSSTSSSQLLVVASRKFSELRLCRFGVCLALSRAGSNAEDIVHSSFIF